MNALAGLMNPAAIGQSVTAAFEAGQAKRLQDDYRNALSAFDPSKPETLRPIMATNPEVGLQLRGQVQQAQQAQQNATIQQQAAAGDPTAMAQLAGIDINAWRGLNADQQAAAKTLNDTIGQTALLADTPQKWDAAIDRLAQQNPAFAKYKGRFDLRETAISQAGLAKQFMDAQQPDYQVIPEGGTLVDTRNPQAVSQFGAGAIPAQGTAAPEAFTGAQIRANIQSMGAAKTADWMRRNNVMIQVADESDYNLVPNGFEYIAPDGTRRRKGGQ